MKHVSRWERIGVSRLVRVPAVSTRAGFFGFYGLPVTFRLPEFIGLPEIFELPNIFSYAKSGGTEISGSPKTRVARPFFGYPHKPGCISEAD